MLSIINDSWLASGGKAKVVAGCIVSEVSELIDHSCHKWDVGKLRVCLEPASAIEAVKTPLGRSNTEDSLFWPLTMDGCYSVKSGYYSVKEAQVLYSGNPSTSYSHSELSWKAIWSVYVPERVKEFGWRIKHNALFTKLNLSIRKLSNDSTCPVCKMEEESLEHLFLLCPWTSPIWFGLQICQVPTKLSVSSMFVWLESFVTSISNNEPNAKENFAKILVTLWNIWKSRNNKVFEDKNPNPTEVLFLIIKQHSEFALANVNASTSIYPQVRNVISRTRWIPPTNGCVKFNVDASFIMSTGRACTGIIGRDEKGTVVTGLSNKFFAATSLMAEASALRDAVTFASGLMFQDVIFESDCLNAIHACNKKVIRKEIEHIVADVQSLYRNFTSISFSWVNREGNTSAYLISKLGASNALPPNWIFELPLPLRSIVIADAEGVD